MRKAIFAAMGEAAAAGSEEVGDEHLLLAITRDRASAGAFMLEHAGLGMPQVREALLNGSSKTKPRQAERMSASAMHVLDLAAAESSRLKHGHIGTEHLLLGLTLSRRGHATEVLSQLGMTHQRASAALDQWIARGMPRQRPQPVSSALDPLTRRIQQILQWPRLGYQVFFRKSLAHPRFVTNPYPLYDWLRKHAPVRRDPILPVWVVTRYADVNVVLRDPRFGKEESAMDALPPTLAEQLVGPADEERIASPLDMTAAQMLFLDPPRHTRIRAAFNKAFTPKTVEALRPRVQQITDRLLDKVQASGRMDLIKDLAYPLPTIVIAELLGLPPEDYERLKVWSDRVTGLLGLNPSQEELNAAGAAVEELREYMTGLLNDERKRPQSGILGALVAGTSDADQLTTAEIFANIVLLLAAGHETTTNLTGNGVLALLRNRSQLDLLRKDPSLITSAVEELLRYDSPVQWTNRVAREDVEIGGTYIERGQMILVSLGAANRDPAQFPDPHRLDIRRADNRHVAFGGGIHFCLGATLARLEGEIAIGTLVQRFPRMRLESRRLHWHKGLTFRGVKSLPLKL